MEEQQNIKYKDWLDERMIHYVKPYFCKYIIASLEVVPQGLPFLYDRLVYSAVF